jgi:hypothetical protein
MLSSEAFMNVAIGGVEAEVSGIIPWPVRAVFKFIGDGDSGTTALPSRLMICKLLATGTVRARPLVPTDRLGEY